jgi:uncharacterized membrane protein
MLVVVFDDESKAYEGSSALSQLDSEGSISVHAKAVIKKNADGTITLKQSKDEFPIRAVGGTAIGALIGLLGGPVGLGIGAAVGAVAGTVWDVDRSGVDAEFIDEVSTKLTPGKWAVVSDISEEWVTPVDTRMDALGGFVYRTTQHDVQHEKNALDIAGLRTDVAMLKAELAQSRKEQKAKLQAKIDKSQGKLHAKMEQAKQRLEQQEKEAKAKVEALEKKAAKAKDETKTTIEARIADIKERSKKSSEEFDKWLDEDDPF